MVSVLAMQSFSNNYVSCPDATTLFNIPHSTKYPLACYGIDLPTLGYAIGCDWSRWRFWPRLDGGLLKFGMQVFDMYLVRILPDSAGAITCLGADDYLW